MTQTRPLGSPQGIRLQLRNKLNERELEPLNAENAAQLRPFSVAARTAASGPLGSPSSRRDNFRPRRSPAPWLAGVLAMERWPRRPPDPPPPPRKPGTNAGASSGEAAATGALKGSARWRELVPGRELGRSAGVECGPGAGPSGGRRAGAVAEVRGRGRSRAV